MKLWVGVTDPDWFAFLSRADVDEVNFWQPSATAPFVGLEPGAPFLFKPVSDALIPRIAASVRAPRPEKPEIHPLSPDQARKLITTARETEDRFEALYVLALHCGLREGELLGLKWDDIDPRAATATLHIRRTLSQTRTGHIFEKPKNGKGRSIKCSQKATEALKRHGSRQNEERQAAGTLWQDNDLVFPTLTGTTKSGTNLLVHLQNRFQVMSYSGDHETSHLCPYTFEKRSARLCRKDCTPKTP